MGGKKSTTTQNVNIPPEVMARYNAVNARAEKAATSPYEKYGTSASDFVAQMNAQQGAGIADINATAGSYQPYMTSATSATQAGMGPAYAGIDNYMSPYIKNVADTTGAMMRQQQEQAQSGALGTAVSSGAFGGDRAGIAAANLQQQNQMGYGKTMADIMNQGYTQALGASQADLARQMQGGAQMAGLGAQSQQLGLQGAQAKIAAGTMEQQTEQAGKDAMVKQFMQEKGYPFQVAQYLANIAMGTGALSGSTTQTTQPLGIFGNLATGGRVGGYAAGGGVSGPMSDSQGEMWGEGYVPGGVLPVGQLMMANPPEQSGGGGGSDAIMRLISMGMGRAEGGGVSGRYGYAEGGGPSVSPEQMAEFLRRQEAIRQNATGSDMAGFGDDTRGPDTTFNNVQAQRWGTEAIPQQIDARPGATSTSGGPGGYTTSLFPDATKTTGESISSALHPLRQNIMADVVGAGGLASAGLWGAGSLVPSGVGAALSALGAENYGGEYLMDVGSGMRGIAGDIAQNSYEQAQRISDTPYTREMPADLAAQVKLATESTANGSGGVSPAVSGIGSAKIVRPPGPDFETFGRTPTGLAPVTSPRPQNRTTGDAAALAADTSAILGQSATGVVAPATATSVVAPATSPDVVAPVSTPATVDPVEFFQTKILGQESGGRQFDENGNPLTSPKGAVGIAQVKEGTGPEAAKLAGLPWDRDRWLNDAEYNKQIGQAYFLDQYRRFGSLDKAAAAYNAGPTALAQAMDRATALGGSYTDYLPQETQKYVKATTGIGGSTKNGVAGPAPATQQTTGGLGGADMAAADGRKPYDERNMIGKFFYDPQTGRLNPVAIKSLLGGLAAMAKSNTVSPISAILQGLGGGMETYSAAQKQVADLAASQATTAQTNVGTTAARFQVTVGGMPQVIMPDNSVVDFYTFKDSPELQAKLGSAQTAAIVKAAEAAGIQTEGGTSSTQVYSKPAVQASLASEENTLRALGGDRTTSNEAIAAINSAASAAGGGIRANTFMQLNAFAGLNANPATASSGFKAPIRAAAVQAVNYAAALAGLPPVSDMAAEAAIIEKASSILGTDAAQRLDANTLGALNVIMTSLPNIEQDKDASAKLMAAIVQGQQRAVDLKDFADGYISRENGNPTLTAFNVEKTFNDMTAQIYEAEKPYMETLIKEGGKFVDPNTGMTPVQALTSGELSRQETADVLSQLFPGGYPSHLVTTFSR